MKPNEHGHYTVVHPLSDAPEEKIISVALPRKDVSTLVVLIVLRVYVVLMLVVVALAIVRFAHG